MAHKPVPVLLPLRHQADETRVQIYQNHRVVLQLPLSMVLAVLHGEITEVRPVLLESLSLENCIHSDEKIWPLTPVMVKTMVLV
jgi:hypothetical protein